MAKNKQPFDYRQSAGIYIGNGVTGEGTMRVSDDIVIDGNFKGKISTPGFCEVTENGTLDGDISAATLTIFGKYNGQCQVKEGLIVKNTAIVNGYLAYTSLNIQPGARVTARFKPLDGAI